MRKVSTQNTDVRTKAAPILRTLIDEIVLHPGDKRGKITIEVRGEPSALFLLANDEPAGANNWTIKVVAEEGLEPPTRGLSIATLNSDNSPPPFASSCTCKSARWRPFPHSGVLRFAAGCHIQPHPFLSPRCHPGPSSLAEISISSRADPARQRVLLMSWAAGERLCSRALISTSITWNSPGPTLRGLAAKPLVAPCLMRLEQPRAAVLRNSSA